jgi:hypothetical protein
MSLKEKVRVILNQKGLFICPNSGGKPTETAATPEGAIDRVLADLQKRGDKRPATLKTLMGSINNLFKKSLSEEQLAVLVGELGARGVVHVEGKKVSYKRAAGA